MRAITCLSIIISGCFFATACGFRAADTSTDGIYDDSLTYRDQDFYLMYDGGHSNLYGNPGMNNQNSQPEDAYYYKRIFQSKSEEYKNMIADTSHIFINKFKPIPKKQTYVSSSKGSMRHFNNSNFRYSPHWSYRYGPYPYYNGYPYYGSYNHFNPYYNNWGPYSYNGGVNPFWYGNNFYLSPFSYSPYFSYGGYYNSSNNTTSYSVKPYIRNGKVYQTKYNIGRKMSSPSPKPSNYNRDAPQFNQSNSYPSRNNNYGNHSNNNSQKLSTPRVRSSR